MTLNQAKLAHAAELVEEVLKGLNRNRKRCDHCGLTVYENRDENLTAVELEAVADKLRRFVGRKMFSKEETTKETT